MRVSSARARARADGGGRPLVGDDAELTPPQAAPPSGLRPYQDRVVADFLRFFANAERGGSRARYGRIVMPPRTGKTVIAAQIIRAMKLPAVFVVPTRTLVVQTAREINAWLGEAVGTYFGEAKQVEPRG